MSRELMKRLAKLERRTKPLPELRAFWKEDDETWEELRERARQWQAEKPEARWPEPMLVGRKDGEPMPDPNRNRRTF